MAHDFQIQAHVMLDDVEMQAIADLVAAGNERGAERFIAYAYKDRGTLMMPHGCAGKMLAEWRANRS